MFLLFTCFFVIIVDCSGSLELRYLRLYSKFTRIFFWNCMWELIGNVCRRQILTKFSQRIACRAVGKIDPNFNLVSVFFTIVVNKATFTSSCRSYSKQRTHFLWSAPEVVYNQSLLLLHIIRWAPIRNVGAISISYTSVGRWATVAKKAPPFVFSVHSHDFFSHWRFFLCSYSKFFVFSHVYWNWSVHTFFAFDFHLQVFCVAPLFCVL